MKLLHATVAVALTRLAVATLALAQTPADVAAAAIPPRVEAGPLGGLTVGFPEVGLVASVPVDRRLAIEAVVSHMPAFWDAPAHALAQVQARIPFREDLRSRKSLLVGVTRIAAKLDEDGFLGTDDAVAIFPHAGVSLQWPISQFADFRFDAQGLFTFDGELPLVPRAMTAIVWHPGQAANNGRSRR